jgi:PleD family two-component response regulator
VLTLKRSTFARNSSDRGNPDAARRGDDVLAAVGGVLQATLRESDFVGRYGGREIAD